MMWITYHEGKREINCETTMNPHLGEAEPAQPDGGGIA